MLPASNTTAASCMFPQEVSLNMDEAIERMGDRDIYLEIAHYFAGHLQQTLKDVASALNQGNSGEAARLAHSLKGNCATVGADSLRDCCLVLEKLCREGNLDAAHEHYAKIAPALLTLRDMLKAL